MKKSRGKIILASESPRRKEMLEKAGFELEIIKSDFDESKYVSTTPEEIAKEFSLSKALLVAAGLGGGIVVGSDTIVAHEGKVIGKPEDEDDARRILSELSGTRHSVISGVAIIDAATLEGETAADETFITMRKMTPQEIDEYVSSGEAMGKAGAYAIQETGDRFVEKMEGNLSTVVGFPMELFLEMIKKYAGKI